MSKFLQKWDIFSKTSETVLLLLLLLLLLFIIIIIISSSWRDISGGLCRCNDISI